MVFNVYGNDTVPLI